MADEKEFIWIGENETCLEEIPYCYAELVQCSEEGKQELKKDTIIVQDKMIWS